MINWCPLERNCLKEDPIRNAELQLQCDLGRIFDYYLIGETYAGLLGLATYGETASVWVTYCKQYYWNSMKGA